MTAGLEALFDRPLIILAAPRSGSTLLFETLAESPGVWTVGGESHSFIEGIRQWANTRGLALRLQAHGGYGDYLDTYALADIPESEGLFAGGSFTTRV